jgi:hypothetical protein
MKLSAIGTFIAVTITVSAGDKPLPPYFEDLKWEPPRSLSNWSNLTVETRTGTFIGMLNDTYPNVRQFLRVPFAQVSVLPRKIFLSFILQVLFSQAACWRSPLDASAETSIFAQKI